MPLSGMFACAASSDPKSESYNQLNAAKSEDVGLYDFVKHELYF